MKKFFGTLAGLLGSSSAFGDIIAEPNSELYRFSTRRFGYNGIEILMLATAFFTASIETIILRLFGYKKTSDLVYFFVINLLSNFVVNNIMMTVMYYHKDWNTILLAELIVVLVEIGLLGIKTGYTKHMCKAVFFTNLISFLIGVLLFSF